jgi:acetoin utilization deacetylase AcuC-like enzyme
VALKIIYHEKYRTNYFTSLAESPLRVSVVHNKLKDHYQTITPEPAHKEDILRVHTLEHLHKVQQEGKDTYQTALLATGGALCAARLAHGNQPSFAIIRPPGHHARRSHYGGFCFFNNIAVAVAHLVESRRIETATIVDIDMHRGDGTANIFAANPSVHIIDIRARAREAYLDLLQKELDRMLATDLVAVSAGFDLYVEDWGALLETADFQQIGCAIHAAAMAKAQGKYFAVLEGGYFLNDLGKNVLAFCQGLEGKPP